MAMPSRGGRGRGAGRGVRGGAIAGRGVGRGAVRGRGAGRGAARGRGGAGRGGRREREREFEIKTLPAETYSNFLSYEPISNTITYGTDD